jgi:hypothetical protein
VDYWLGEAQGAGGSIRDMLRHTAETAHDGAISKSTEGGDRYVVLFLDLRAARPLLPLPFKATSLVSAANFTSSRYRIEIVGSVQIFEEHMDMMR